MRIPETSRLFTRWRNPASGVESLVLTERPAPVQQSFYYTSPSFSSNGRFLWLRCGFPPRGGRYSQQVLGVADLECDEVRVYPETQFPCGSPAVDFSTGDAYWANHLDIWKRGPLATDRAMRINSFPQDLAVGRLERLSTHLTFSADRCSLNIDARFIQSNGRQTCYIGELPLDGSAFKLWQKIEGRFHNHGLFSPTDPDLQIFAHEYWQDHSAESFNALFPYHRIWIIRRGEDAEPLLNAPVSHSGHEWWDASGRHIWYLHYGVGIKKVSLATRQEVLVWPGALSHAHSDRTSRYLVADCMDSPSNPDCHVVFRNTITGKEVEIIHRGPLASGLTQCTHLHPHPQFCLNDRYICYTTIVHDRVDVALVSVADLIERTSGSPASAHSIEGTAQ